MYDFDTISVRKKDKEIFMKLCKKNRLKQNVMFRKILRFYIKEKINGRVTTG